MRCVNTYNAFGGAGMARLQHAAYLIHKRASSLIVTVTGKRHGRHDFFMFLFFPVTLPPFLRWCLPGLASSRSKLGESGQCCAC